MFNKLSHILKQKFSRQDELSRRVEIVRVFDIYKEALKDLVDDTAGFQPISLKNKALTIQTPGASAANELRLNETKILQKINKNFPEKEVVKRIIYRF